MSKIEQTAAFNPGDDGQRLIVFTIDLGQTAQVALFPRMRFEGPTLAPASEKSRGLLPARALPVVFDRLAGFSNNPKSRWLFPRYEQSTQTTICTQVSF
jgi:hypothetical protein